MNPDLSDLKSYVFSFPKSTFPKLERTNKKKQKNKNTKNLVVI